MMEPIITSMHIRGFNF